MRLATAWQGGPSQILPGFRSPQLLPCLTPTSRLPLPPEATYPSSSAVSM